MSSRGFGRSWFARLAPLFFLALVMFVAPGTAHASKVTISFSGLPSNVTGQLAADLSGTRQWVVYSTDSAAQRTKNLSQGSSFVFTASVPAGTAYVVSAVSTASGPITPTFLVTDHTSTSYHNTATFNFTVPSTDTTVYLTFVPRYVVKSTITSGNATGSLTLPDGTSIVGTTYWGQNETATITAKGATGYGLETFLIGTDAKSVTGYPGSQVFTSSPITKSMDDTLNNPGIKAGFVKTYSIVPSTDQGGVTGAGYIDPSTYQTVKAGASITFTVNAVAGSKILKVDVDGVTVVNQPSSPYAYTFSAVSANHTIKAWFNTPAIDVRNYCIKPSFLTENVKPNLLLMLDNSASQYDLAYSNTTTYCYDSSYNKDYGYYGNFDKDTGYSYNFTTQQFDIGSTTKPGSCTYSTSYFCLSTDSSGAATSFWAKGKFLNWLSASKLDQEKRILTGGKYDPDSKVLVSESRGCVGRRFVKDIPSADWVDSASGTLTFGVRGPNSYDSDYVNQGTQGGKTRIEIFKGSYDSTHCNAAVTDWSNPSSMGDIQAGGTQSNTTLCLGSSGNLKSSAYNSIIHLCYRSLSSSGNINGSGELNTLESTCNTSYGTLYGWDPSAITNNNAGDAVCASMLSHPPSAIDGNQIGYLGQCWSRATDATTGAYLLDSSGNYITNWNSDCVLREINDYCAGTHAFDVTDPSDGSKIAGTGTSAASITPSFIIDAGLAALGSPVATMLAHVSQPESPTGLIDEFKDVIRFGAMQFNINGANNSECSNDLTSLVKCAQACKKVDGSYADPYRECYSQSDCPSGTTCGPVTARDGGKIVAYVGDPIGDHKGPPPDTPPGTNGVIKTIDDMAAGTWTPLAEAFYNAIGYYANRGDLQLNSDDFDRSKNPSTYTCRDNYVLILSDGESTVDTNSAVGALLDPGHASTVGICGNAYKGSSNLDDLVLLARTKNIKDFTKDASMKNDHVLTYVINTGRAPAATDTDECSSPGLLLDHASQNGVPGGTAAPVAGDADKLASTMREVFSKVATRVSSGTAASILSNSEGSGANLLQAIFFPIKTFDQLNSRATWIGELQDFWYYIDPFIGRSSVREDSDWDGVTKQRSMNLKTDYVVQFVFDDKSGQTLVNRLIDADGNGTGDNPATPATVSTDDVMSLFKAGQNLWLRDPASRKIYTQQNGALVNFTATDLGTSSESVYRYLFQTDSAAQANDIISYVTGTDLSKFRSRSLVIPNHNSDQASVWKLGDIISSTPRVQSSNKLNTYQLAPPLGYNDVSYDKFSTTNEYLNRGMAYVGANDGMLHAFKAGKLKVATSGDQKATLDPGSGGVLGNEEWAFIPRNAIPYLTYLTDPGYTDQTHVYFVDGTPTLSDVSMSTCSGSDYWSCPKDTARGSNWRTVLVGGMGLGGASKDYSYTGDVTSSVKTPLPGVGYSSYFALDISKQTFDGVTGLRDPDTQKPTLLWEFAHPQLGYAISGPAIVRIAAKGDDGRPDNTKNGRWFAVFASGPTGAIKPQDCFFQGNSDQGLKLFVVDLNATGAWTLGTNYWVFDANVPSAFGGSISGGVIDADRWNKAAPGFYQDDAIYVGYTRNTSSDGSGTWTQGGVVRLLTHESIDPGGAMTGTTKWTVDTVIDGIGPVTSNIARLQDRKNHNLWLYFGTGRYFYNGDDMSSGRKLFGIKDPCYTPQDTIRKDCSAGDQINNLFLTNQSGDSPTDALTPGLDNGWFITLDGEDTVNKLGAERAVTDAVAMTNGAVYFTTYKPTNDACKYGGKSRMWAVKYDTGYKAPDAALQGKALVQISTGEFKEIDLAKAFTLKFNRAMGDEMTGKPPADPPPIVTKANLKPVKKILHISEH